ncbi:MAG: transketolase [bacterium]|nr:transketolase [bacterium]
MKEPPVPDVSRQFEAQKANFARWEILKDIIDQQIDLMLNYRQSGHPGGSRSKAHYFISLLLSGAMRWDIRDPGKRFGDRFVLVAGHTVPLVYGTLAVFNEALRLMYAKTGDAKYLVHGGSERMLTWEDLLDFRDVGGLPGHAEMAGKNLFVKFNTGPSGHGAPAAVGEALALRCAGARDVRVFGIEGEGGHTAGCWHEAKNSAYGLGLDNLCIILDWNDYGIDSNAYSSIVHGTPRDWFTSYGWDVHEAVDGSDWTQVTRALLETVHGPGTPLRPRMVFGRTRKGRGYHTYDNNAHGSAHKMNGEKFWLCRQDFSDIYGTQWHGQGEAAPADAEARREQFAANLNAALDVLRRDEDLVRYLADRLVELGDSVPTELPGFRLPESKNPLKDPALLDVAQYPAELWAKPGARQPNRAALSAWGSYINSWSLQKYGRPLFLVCAADLAGSTNIDGFAKPFGDMPNLGWYQRETNPDGVLLPQGITEFANAGIMVGAASVNFSSDPENEFNGFFTACSTYAAFSYLKYGPMRLYSQLAQDCELKVGTTIWVAGHSGPETGEDSRTHFGIFSPGATQMFPDGQVIDIHPWEYNEVPVMIAAALATGKPIVALHLTRPPVKIPDRQALGLGSHFEAARGAYILRDWKPGLPRQGVVMVQGTMSTAGLIEALPAIDAAGVNVKFVAVPSPQLFALQDEDYQEQVLSPGDRLNSTYITNRARRTMFDWTFNPLAERYAMSSDWDDEWRPGGSPEDVCENAGLDAESIAQGVIAFAEDWSERMKELGTMLGQARG